MSARVPRLARWLLTRLPASLGWGLQPGGYGSVDWLLLIFFWVQLRQYSCSQLKSYCVFFPPLLVGWSGNTWRLSWQPSQLLSLANHHKTSLKGAFSVHLKSYKNRPWWAIIKTMWICKTRHLKYKVVGDGGWDLWMARAGYAGVLRNSHQINRQCDSSHMVLVILQK